MTKTELATILDPNEFRHTLSRAKISDEKKQEIIRLRSKLMYEKYKPEDMEWYREIYGVKNETLR